MDLCLDDLKKKIFFDMLDIAGRVFIAVSCSEDVVIGKRGFLDQEKEKGLILVFNRKMKFQWDDDGISATLAFGTRPEKCFIPLHAVTAIFSPELNAQFSVVPKKETEAGTESPGEKTAVSSGPAEKVIKVDFKKKR